MVKDGKKHTPNADVAKKRQRTLMENNLNAITATFRIDKNG
jgi:hypothetical protein